MKRQGATTTTYGLEHPAETFEFARFLLLNYYAGNASFRAELEQLASRHQETIEAVARQRVWGISEIADYRASWGMLSFLTRDPGPGKTPHPLKGPIESYRADLGGLAERWGLAANWCAPSLHEALLAPKVFPDNFRDACRVGDPAQLFMWDIQRRGRPPHDTILTLPRLLLRSDAPRRQIDMRLLTHGGESVYYDPRTDRWGDSLAQAATLLGRTRLPATLREKLLQQRRKIEDALLVDGYRARRRPRRSRGQHALVRWTYWTYLAICPPNRTTGQIMEIIARCSINTQYLDRAIKQVLDLLRLPGRHVRPS